MTTPAAGIRLAGGRPVPPAPSLGTHWNVTAGGSRLGAVVETMLGMYVAVCGHPDCRAALIARPTDTLAKSALYGHWQTTHVGDAR